MQQKKYTTTKKQPTRNTAQHFLELFAGCVSFVVSCVKKTMNPEVRFARATNYKLKDSRLGFTLIEMMVAVSLFAVVSVISLTALISINNVNKKAQTIRTIIDNFNFAMENMARNMRVGSTYHCDIAQGTITTVRDCAVGGASSVAFESYNGSSANPNDQIIYRLNGNSIEKSINGGSSYLPITSSELRVDYLNFFVDGSVVGDNKEPRVIITVGGSVIYNNIAQSTFKIQTMVSQRRIDS